MGLAMSKIFDRSDCYTGMFLHQIRVFVMMWGQFARDRTPYSCSSLQSLRRKVLTALQRFHWPDRLVRSHVWLVLQPINRVLPRLILWFPLQQLIECRLLVLRLLRLFKGIPWTELECLFAELLRWITWSHIFQPVLVYVRIGNGVVDLIATNSIFYPFLRGLRILHSVHLVTIGLAHLYWPYVRHLHIVR